MTQEPTPAELGARLREAEPKQGAVLIAQLSRLGSDLAVVELLVLETTYHHHPEVQIAACTAIPTIYRRGGRLAKTALRNRLRSLVAEAQADLCEPAAAAIRELVRIDEEAATGVRW